MKKTFLLLLITVLFMCIQSNMYAREEGGNPGEPYVSYREGNIYVDLDLLNPLDGGTLDPLELTIYLKYETTITYKDYVTGNNHSWTQGGSTAYIVKESTNKIHYKYVCSRGYDTWKEGIKYRVIEHNTVIQSITYRPLKKDIYDCFQGNYYRVDYFQPYNNYNGDWDVTIDVSYIGTDVIDRDLILGLGLTANGNTIIEKEYTNLYYGYPAGNFLGFFLEVYPQIATTRLLWDTLSNLDYSSREVYSPDLKRYDFKLKGIYFYYDIIKQKINFKFSAKISLKASFALLNYSGHVYFEVLRDDQATYTIMGYRLGTDTFVISGTMKPVLDDGVVFELGDFDIQIPTYRTWTSNDGLSLLRSMEELAEMVSGYEPINDVLNREIKEGIIKELPKEFKIGKDELLTLLEDIGTMLYEYLKDKLYDYCDDLDKNYNFTKQEFYGKACDFIDNLLKQYVPEAWLRNELRNKLRNYADYLTKMFIC